MSDLYKLVKNKQFDSEELILKELKRIREDLYQSMDSFLPLVFEKIISFNEIATKNFCPVYRVIGIKKGKKISVCVGVEETSLFNLRYEFDKEVNTKVKYFIEVSKPDYKDKKKWKFLFRFVRYDLLDATLMLMKIE